MSDSFNPEDFLSASFTDPTDTRRTPCPVGEYIGEVDSVKPRGWQSKDGTKAGVAYDVMWNIEDEGARAAVGRAKVLVRQTFMFNFIEGTQQIDHDNAKTNVAFGKFREAIGCNDGEFSWLMAVGRRAKVKVGHEMYKGEPQDGVEAVTAL